LREYLDKLREVPTQGRELDESEEENFFLREVTRRE
jgi:hypothetical protein